MLRAPVLVGIILVRTLAVHVVLVVHVLGLSLSLMLGLLAVKPVLALCLGLPSVNILYLCGRDRTHELVDFGTCEAGEKFFGELVGDGLAWS